VDQTLDHLVKEALIPCQTTDYPKSLSY
jgi:hypothetical protein